MVSGFPLWSLIHFEFLFAQRWAESTVSDESHFSFLWEGWPLKGRGIFLPPQSPYCASDGACHKQAGMATAGHR